MDNGKTAITFMHHGRRVMASITGQGRIDACCGLMMPDGWRMVGFEARCRLLVSSCRLWQVVACGKLSLVASCRLWQVVACGKLSLVASCRLWQVVACGKLSLVASCRLWQVVASGKLSLLASCHLWQVVALRWL